MRKYGQWLLALGMMAACPAVVSADGFLGRGRPAAPLGGSTQSSPNQVKANEVAQALREAKLNGYNVDIEVKDGIAVLQGNVRDASHRALATQVVSGVPGISRVDNQLRYVPEGGIEQAAFEPSAQQGSQIRRVSGESGPSNQQVAEQIGAALSGSGLVGYDIEVRFNSGIATLGGNVGTAQQRQAATDAVSRVPGVKSVNNQLQVNPAITQTSFAPAMPMPMGGHPGMMPPGGMMQPGMAPTAMGMTPASYTNPHFPGHAWPAYAQYPNSAAVSYPTQYSASAWPYIGPFYPYPQVPLGWREVSLEWDDGYWQLNFNKEKDKWYWILNPKHW